MALGSVITSTLKRVFPTPRKIYRYIRDLRAYNKLNTRPEFHASMKHLFPVIWDWNRDAGTLGSYFWQDLWAAKKIFNTRPSEHYDIGSRVDGFIAHVLLFMPVTMIDIRPLSQSVEGLNFTQADATNLDGIEDESIVSLSSLCAPEHFGLGRYGDPVDPEACFAALRSMQRVLAHDGHLYIAVPVGEESRVEFNAHRIFTPELIISTLDDLRLVDFSVISGPNGYLKNLSLDDFHAHSFKNVVGLFEFVKD